VAAVTAAITATGTASAATYHGYVGPGSSISLRNAAGARVARVPTGRHTFVIHDRSRAHNFTLRRGTTRLRTTSTEGTGTYTWRRVRITAGRYVYFCSTHPDLRGSFRAR
jgi:hypothetical protein